MQTPSGPGPGSRYDRPPPPPAGDIEEKHKTTRAAEARTGSGGCERRTCSTDSAASLGATCSLISSIFSTKIFLSSVISMEATGVPSTFTRYFSRTPCLVSSTPQFRAVWPPKVSSTPSGRSFLITCRRCREHHRRSSPGD